MKENAGQTHNQGMKRNVASILSLPIAALILSGCGASSNSAEPAPSSSVATGGVGGPGMGTVVAPIFVDPATVDGTTVSVPLDNVVVINVDDPTAWTGKVDDESVATFTPGSADGTATFNPGVQPVTEGTTSVTITDGTGKAHTFTLVVTAKAGITDLVAPPAMDISPETTAMATKVIGMTEKDAVAAIESIGDTSRVGRRDKETFALTMDYRTDRITLEIDNGKVTSALVG